MKSTETDKKDDTFTNKQKWFIENILTLLENQKTELMILTRRVTDLEIQNYKNLRKWQNENGEKEQSLFEGQNQS